MMRIQKNTAGKRNRLTPVRKDVLIDPGIPTLGVYGIFWESLIGV
jgi:hypothetical protein